MTVRGVSPEKKSRKQVRSDVPGWQLATASPRGKNCGFCSDRGINVNMPNYRYVVAIYPATGVLYSCLVVVCSKRCIRLKGHSVG